MVRTTRAMREAIARARHLTCPAPESLVPFALGGGDHTIAQHVERCPTCRAEVERLREAADSLRMAASADRRIETPDCLEENAIADFVEGRLAPEARTPVVAHLLTCARCRSLVRATGRLLADPALTPDVRRPWRRWSVPLGLAAAAALVLAFWPSSGDHRSPPPELREPPLTSTLAPSPIAPRASVGQVDRLVWSSVPHAERYRVRLYDSAGSAVWTVETADTSVALPDSVGLTPRATYFWKVEAQTEWRRWAASDLVEFRVGSPR